VERIPTIFSLLSIFLSLLFSLPAQGGGEPASSGNGFGWSENTEKAVRELNETAERAENLSTCEWLELHSRALSKYEPARHCSEARIIWGYAARRDLALLDGCRSGLRWLEGLLGDPDLCNLNSNGVNLRKAQKELFEYRKKGQFAATEAEGSSEEGKLWSDAYSTLVEGFPAKGESIMEECSLSVVVGLSSRKDQFSFYNKFYSRADEALTVACEPGSRSLERFLRSETRAPDEKR